MSPEQKERYRKELILQKDWHERQIHPLTNPIVNNGNQVWVDILEQALKDFESLTERKLEEKIIKAKKHFKKTADMTERCLAFDGWEAREFLLSCFRICAHDNRADHWELDTLWRLYLEKKESEK